MYCFFSGSNVQEDNNSKGKTRRLRRRVNQHSVVVVDAAFICVIKVVMKRLLDGHSRARGNTSLELKAFADFAFLVCEGLFLCAQYFSLFACAQHCKSGAESNNINYSSIFKMLLMYCIICACNN